MSGTDLLVAAVQACSQDDVAENLRRATARIGEAAAAGARVVVLPENFAYFGSEEGKRAIAERLDGAPGPIRSALGDAAARTGVHVVAGGMPERSDDPARPYNACVWIGPDGATRGIYRKIHLFDVDLPDGSVYRESTATRPGDEPVLVEAEGFRFGLSVCYDVRFPELYRALSARGADVFLVPAAFTVATGKDHWHVLLRARAIEAQAWVVAAAQCGTHPRGRQTYGKSLVADPWGDVVAQASDGEHVLLARLDRATLDRVRAKLPALRHRRI